MQRKYTIELCVDFADPGKLPEIKKTLLGIARHAYSAAQLMSDNRKSTTIAIHSDDFFSGVQEIALFEDIIGHGLEQINEKSGDAGSVSDEMMEAFK